MASDFLTLQHLMRRGNAGKSMFSSESVGLQIFINAVFLLALLVPFVWQLSRTVRSTEATVKGWNKDQVTLINDLRREQLLRRVDQVLDQWEERLMIGLFPTANRVHRTTESVPEDTLYGKHCAAIEPLNDPQESGRAIYREALSFDPTMPFFDAVIFPTDIPPMVRGGPNVLVDSTEDSTLRNLVQERIRGKLDTWLLQSVSVQRRLVIDYLGVSKRLKVDDPDPNLIRKKVRKLFQDQGCLLLETAL